MISTVVSLMAVAALWGGTNPFLKRGTKGINQVKADTIPGQLYAEVVFLVTNWRYVLPFLVNQCGSVLYLLVLQTSDLSLAVPVTNSLTFVVTALVGWALGEEALTIKSMLGIIFIIMGTTLCFVSS